MWQFFGDYLTKFWTYPFWINFSFVLMIVSGLVWFIGGKNYQPDKPKPKTVSTATFAKQESVQPILKVHERTGGEDNNRSVISAERLRLELAFLDELDEKITKDIHPIFETAHHLRNDWPEEMLQTGKEPMKAKIKNMQERLNQEIKILAPFLLKNFYLGDLAKSTHQESVTMMVDLIHEGDTLINRADALGEVTRTNLQFLMPDRERFGDKVTKWGDWIDNLKKTIQKRKSELLAT